MLRVRFKANYDDPRPVNWPVKHPFWVSGSGDGYSIVISYADNKEYIHENWPEATDLDVEEVEGYVFTDRFPKPDWLKLTPSPSEQNKQRALDDLLNALSNASFECGTWGTGDGEEDTEYLETLKKRDTAMEAARTWIVSELDAKDVETERLQNLAYIGEHHFPDNTWKARVTELVTDLRTAEASLATARADAVREIARWPKVYAEGIESQNDLSAPVENWSDFHKGQAHAAKEFTAALESLLNEKEEKND